MDGKLFGFIAGSFSALMWTSLPPLLFLFILLLTAILCLRFSRARIVCPFLLGIIWFASVGHWRRHWQLPLEQISQAILVSGRLQSLISSEQQVRFNLRLETLEQYKSSWTGDIRLIWAQPKWPLKQVQKVSLKVKLKPAHSLANEGGFHYQQWLFSQG